MTSAPAATLSRPGIDRHPRGLYVLFSVEMWERFGFYSLLAMFTLYLRNEEQGFGWTAAQATSLYATYMMFVYASPLVGGWIADRLTGFRLAISIGGVLLGVGYFLLSIPSLTMVYAAITLLVIGNGLFKPNVSAMVGNLYPEGSKLKDSAYNIFYVGINIGALLAPIASETVMQRYGFRTGFVMAAGGMVVSVLILWLFHSSVSGSEKSRFAGVVRAEEKKNLDDPLGAVPEGRRIFALIVIFVIVVIFWMIFHQNGATLTYWANDNTDWTKSPTLLYIIYLLTLGTVKPDVGNVSGVIAIAINPFWIIVLTPVLLAFWRALGRRGLEPSTPGKMTVGMFLTAVAFYIMATAALNGGDAGKVSPWWLVLTYAVISLAELMLSPMGLSLVSKVAPARMRGLMMGGWFFATAMGNRLTAIGVYWEVWKHSTFFFILASMALIMGVVLIILLRPLKRAMPGV